jgi:hypothetical protein
MGEKIHSNELRSVLGKDLQSGRRLRGLKQAGLQNPASKKLLTVKQVKEILGAQQKQHYLKGEMEGLGTYRSSAKHLTSAVISAVKEAREEKKAAFKAAKTEEVNEVRARREKMQKRNDEDRLEQNLLKHREEVKQQNLAARRADVAKEKLAEINKDKAAAGAPDKAGGKAAGGKTAQRMVAGSFRTVTLPKPEAEPREPAEELIAVRKSIVPEEKEDAPPVLPPEEAMDIETQPPEAPKQVIGDASKAILPPE